MRLGMVQMPALNETPPPTALIFELLSKANCCPTSCRKGPRKAHSDLFLTLSDEFCLGINRLGGPAFISVTASVITLNL